MAITIKHIAAGHLNNSQSSYADLSAAVGANKAQVIKNMRFTNTSTTAAITLNVAVYSTNPSPFSGTDAKVVSPANVSIAPGASYLDNSEITLEYNQKLQYKTGTTGGPIDFVVSGIERDV